VKKTLMLMAMVLVALPALAGEPAHMAHKTPSGWFDMENCYFCKNLVADPELLSHCRWETQPTADGMMTIMAVEPAWRAAMAKAGAGMEECAAKLHGGQVDMAKVKLCGFCQAYGELVTAGVQPETIKGQVAEVSVFRSSDPKLVQKMHEIARRNTEEMAIMMAAAGDPHAGHQH
jgi:hypothetical protein